MRAAAAFCGVFVAATAALAAQPYRPAGVVPPRAGAAEPATVCVTLVDGAASLLHGPARYALAEGVRLQRGDIVEVARGLVLLERADGAEVGVASGTRVMLMPGSPPALFVLVGQVKGISPNPSAPVRIGSREGNASVSDGALVLAVSDVEESVFAESGKVLLDGQPPVTLQPGEFCARRAGRKPLPTSRPPQAFIASLPRPFVDPLPSRLARFASRPVPLGPPQPFTYADVQAWLRGPAPVRRILTAEWAPKAADPAFRKALLANLAHHPEWDRVLFPEKHEPKGKKLP